MFEISTWYLNKRKTIIICLKIHASHKIKSSIFGLNLLWYFISIIYIYAALRKVIILRQKRVKIPSRKSLKSKTYDAKQWKSFSWFLRHMGAHNKTMLSFSSTLSYLCRKYNTEKPLVEKMCVIERKMHGFKTVENDLNNCKSSLH